MECNEKQLRNEFNNKTFRNILEKELGCKCANCKSEEYIEFHHIVPISNGGTNNITNIVPLCLKCHYNAHKRTYTKGVLKARQEGRKHKKTYEECKPYFKLYFENQIGRKELIEKCGYSHKYSISDSPYYKKYKEEYGIKDFKNKVDILNSNKNRGSRNIRKRKNKTKEKFVCIICNKEKNTSYYLKDNGIICFECINK